MISIKNVNLNLEDTISCGQIFRYNKEDDNSFTVILSDRVVNLKMDNNTLLIESNNYDNLENIIKNYLDLNTDYEKINEELLNIDPNLKEIINSSRGLKMIRQPKIECMISYIISQNNKVPQIKKVLDNISEYGNNKVIFKNKEYYLFPTLDKLKDISIEEFRSLKAGFRDKYLYNFIQKLYCGEIDLDYIEKLSSIDALNYLIKINGIGEKVASCILLFSYSRFDVFPIDTWVKKYMKDEYSIEGVNNIRNFIYKKYDKYSAIIIQYMFHFKRNKEKLLEKV